MFLVCVLEPAVPEESGRHMIVRVYVPSPSCVAKYGKGRQLLYCFDIFLARMLASLHIH